MRVIDRFRTLFGSIRNFFSTEGRRLRKTKSVIIAARKTNQTAINLSDRGLTDAAFKTLLPELMKCPNLQELNLSGNLLENLPDRIGALTALTRLDLGNNRLQDLPEGICRLTGLRNLNLANNRLRILPEGIANLTHLEQLYLSENRFRVFPEALGRLTNLLRLDLDHNQLENLPEAISALTDLRILDLSYNELNEIHQAIGKLRALYSLNLSGNQLYALPDTMKKLISLVKLDLSRNWLGFIPESVANLPRLHDLNVAKNYLTKAAISVVKGARRAKHLYILNYASDLESAALFYDVFKDEPGNILTAFAAMKLGKFPIKTRDGGNIEVTAPEVLLRLMETMANSGITAHHVDYITALAGYVIPILEKKIGEEEARNRMSILATTLGDCGTPVKDVLREIHVGQRTAAHNKMDVKEEQEFEKTAVKEWILGNAELMQEIAKGDEGVEALHGLLNAFYFWDAWENERNNLKIFADRPPFYRPTETYNTNLAYGLITPKMIEIITNTPLFIKDETGKPFQDSEGRYHLNLQELNALKEDAAEARHIETEQTRNLQVHLNDYTQKMQEKLQTDELMSELATEYFEMPEAARFLDIDGQVSELKKILRRTAEENQETIAAEFFADKILEAKRCVAMIAARQPHETAKKTKEMSVRQYDPLQKMTSGGVLRLPRKLSARLSDESVSDGEEVQRITIKFR